MAQKFTNNAFSSLAAALTSIGTTLTVASGQGDRFPVVTAPDFAMVTLQDAANNIEIVKVTSRLAGGDAMTIVRAQEGTTARAWSIGDIVELRITAFGLNPLSVFEGGATAAALRLALLVPTRTGGDASGNWNISILGNAATATTATTAGTTTGNAGTATSLQTPRAINGANFDGSAAITTLSWGTARTITLGATGKSVNGSADVAWTLAEIGAAAASATLNLTGDQSAAGIKTWTGQQAWNGGAIHTFGNVVGAFTGLFMLGGRTVRKVTTGNAIEIVNQANTAVTHTLADNGDFTAAGNVTAFSDERLKKDWTPLDVLALIRGLAGTQAGSYTRIDTGERQIGLSAQSLRPVMPEAVPENADGMLSVAYGNAALVACVALAREVVQLRERLAVLEAR